MAKKPTGSGSGGTPSGGNGTLATVSCGIEKLLLAALARGGSCLETGRFLISYREGTGRRGYQVVKSPELSGR
ncbi:hypothetical protein HSBAA_26930 [Vreelandella sulfidaeris]|uniref:Uncharacterized protein n=1 Tax=Vreelandella sulfidaeris TaxID=115553 RepID=A0A455U773_9GAMM|nr:hypothetical protein HSBAA_26930 [Halomonas sulfidaeris]